MKHGNLDWLTVSDAAQELQVSEKTIRKQIVYGDLKAYRFGGRAIRIKRSEIEKAMKPIKSVADYLQ